MACNRISNDSNIIMKGYYISKRVIQESLSEHMFLYNGSNTQTKMIGDDSLSGIDYLTGV